MEGNNSIEYKTKSVLNKGINRVQHDKTTESQNVLCFTLVCMRLIIGQKKQMIEFGP